MVGKDLECHSASANQIVFVARFRSLSEVEMVDCGPLKECTTGLPWQPGSRIVRALETALGGKCQYGHIAE